MITFLKSNSDFFLALVLALAGIFIFFPGAMSGDSVDQWRQVQTPDQIGNWFPPIMVYLWILINKITYGPQGMLVFQYVFYFLSIYIFGKLFINRLPNRLIYIFFIGLFPPIFFLTGVIWKDVSLLVGISMSIALLLLFERTHKKIFIIFSLIFYVYGISVRHNGLVCSIPYSYYLVSLLLKKDISHRSYYLCISVFVMVLCFFMTSTLLSNYKVKDVWKTYHFENAVFLWDLWGMSIELNENIIPQYVFNKESRNLGVDTLGKYYNRESNSIIFLMQFLTEKRFKKDFPNAQFKKDFIKAIIKHPVTYMKVRGRLTLYMLGYRLPIQPFIFSPPKFGEKHYLHRFSKGLEFSNPEITGVVGKLARYLFYNTPLWRIWIYIVLALLQVILLIFITRISVTKEVYCWFCLLV